MRAGGAGAATRPSVAAARAARPGRAPRRRCSGSCASWTTSRTSAARSSSRASGTRSSWRRPRRCGTRERGRASVAAPARKAKAPAGQAAPGAGPRGFLATASRAARVRVGRRHRRRGRALLVFVVWRQAKPREEGGSLTGQPAGRGGRAAPPDEPAGADPTTRRRSSRRRSARNPDDLEARLDLAQLHLRQRDLMGVWNETQYVLGEAAGPAARARLPGARAPGHGPARRRASRMLKQATRGRPGPPRRLPAPGARLHADGPRRRRRRR